MRVTLNDKLIVKLFEYGEILRYQSFLESYFKLAGREDVECTLESTMVAKTISSNHDEVVLKFIFDKQENNPYDNIVEYFNNITGYEMNYRTANIALCILPNSNNNVTRCLQNLFVFLVGNHHVQHNRNKSIVDPSTIEDLFGKYHISRNLFELTAKKLLVALRGVAGPKLSHPAVATLLENAMTEYFSDIREYGDKRSLILPSTNWSEYSPSVADIYKKFSTV